MKRISATYERTRHEMKITGEALSHMSFAQKLDLLETLWTELIRDEKRLKSPAWHDAVLKDREKALAAGKLSVSDWEQVKKRIKKKVS